MRESKIEAMHRPHRRALLRQRHGADSRPFARQRSGLPTGTTPHFKLWMADLRMQSNLQKLKLDSLADATGTPSTIASSFALLYIGGIKNVYQLATAPIERLLKVRGIGIKRLEAIEAELLKRHVKTSWTVKD